MFKYLSNVSLAVDYVQNYSVATRQRQRLTLQTSRSILWLLTVFPITDLCPLPEIVAYLTDCANTPVLIITFYPILLLLIYAYIEAMCPMLELYGSMEATTMLCL